MSIDRKTVLFAYEDANWRMERLNRLYGATLMAFEMIRRIHGRPTETVMLEIQHSLVSIYDDKGSILFTWDSPNDDWGNAAQTAWSTIGEGTDIFNCLDDVPCTFSDLDRDQELYRYRGMYSATLMTHRYAKSMGVEIDEWSL